MHKKIDNMRNTMNTFFTILVVVVLSSCNSSRAKKDDVSDQLHANTVSALAVKDMHDDLHILWAAIKEVHPGYGIYTPVDSLQKVYDKTYASIQAPLTEDQFITAIYPFVCNLRCGHTQIKHSKDYKPPIGLKVPHLPFKVLVRDHRVWVTTHQTAQLATGDEIISINDVAVDKIIDHGYDLYSDDGYNETFKELFLSEYDGFEDACNKYYHWSGSYKLKLHSNSAALSIVWVNEVNGDVSAHDPGQKDNTYSGWTTAESIPDSRLRLWKNTPVALFKSTPFAYEDTIVFKNAFRLIKQKGIKTLILDLRHNSGGDIRVATKLLSYLADSPFEIIKDVNSRLSNPAINTFAKYFDPLITQGFTDGFKIAGKEGTWYHVAAKPAFGKLYGPFPLDKTDHFDGKLLVLIDGATFSSGALFSAAVKAQRQGVVFIGRETAGSEEGCNGVTLQELTLPHSKIIVDFPLMRVTSVAKNPLKGRGIIPDYPVTYSPEDIVAQNDQDIKKALGMVNR